MKFSRTVRFLGRNGTFKASGIEIQHYSEGDFVGLIPVTSKGYMATCCIEIPIEDCKRLGELLIGVHKDGWKEIQPS